MSNKVSWNALNDDRGAVWRVNKPFFLLSKKSVSKEKRERVTSDKFLSRSRILLLLITLRELWRHEVNILREKFLNKLMLLDARAIKITCAPKNLHLAVEKIQYQLNSITIKYVLHAPFLSIFLLCTRNMLMKMFLFHARRPRGGYLMTLQTPFKRSLSLLRFLGVIPWRKVRWINLLISMGFLWRSQVQVEQPLCRSRDTNL